MQDRIQKILSNAGITSRRNAEAWIQAGRITVNDKVVRLGDKADPDKDVIKLDEEKLNLKTTKTYIAFYKPKFYLVSTVPEGNKKTIYEFIKLNVRVYPVGRLDYDTEGLLLLTNDGDFANKVMHPRYEQEKTYLVKTKEPLIDNSIKHINQGVNVMGRKVDAKAKIVNRDQHLLEITLHEGRKHIVKKLMFKLGYLVRSLKRIRVGDISIGNLKPGEYRPLTEQEIRQLKQ